MVEKAKLDLLSKGGVHHAGLVVVGVMVTVRVLGGADCVMVAKIECVEVASLEMVLGSDLFECQEAVVGGERKVDSKR